MVRDRGAIRWREQASSPRAIRHEQERLPAANALGHRRDAWRCTVTVVSPFAAIARSVFGMCSMCRSLVPRSELPLLGGGFRHCLRPHRRVVLGSPGMASGPPSACRSSSLFRPNGLGRVERTGAVACGRLCPVPNGSGLRPIQSRQNVSPRLSGVGCAQDRLSWHHRYAA